MNFFKRITDRKSAILLFGLFVILLFPALVVAIDPTVVTLLYFRGNGLDSAVHLEWATGTEFDTVGFWIERSNSSAGPYALLTDIGFVPSEAPPDGLSGAEYDVIDDNGAINGNTYWYRLVEIESSGTENRTDPISVTAGLAVSTSTPTNTPTQSPTAASSGESTTVPGTTQTPAPTLPPAVASSTPSTPASTRIIDTTSSRNSQPDSTRMRQTDIVSAAIEGSTGSDSLLQSSAIQSATNASGYPEPDTPSTPLPNSRIGVEGYPGTAQDTIFDLPDAYPSLPEDARSGDASDPLGESSITAGPDVIGRANSISSSTGPEQSEQEPAATLMLWVGFLAALVLFVAAVIGSAYIYRRQSSK